MLVSSPDTNNLNYEGLAKSDLTQFLKQTIQKSFMLKALKSPKNAQISRASQNKIGLRIFEKYEHFWLPEALKGSKQDITGGMHSGVT